VRETGSIFGHDSKADSVHDLDEDDWRGVVLTDNDAQAVWQLPVHNWNGEIL